jgi:hypothetical protein
MAHLVCSEIKSSTARYLEGQLLISGRPDDACVITLPIKTLDGRWVSVIVEQKLEDSFRVHDGGKTDSELFSQGVKMTDADEETHAAIAAEYGVSIGDRIIQKVCRRADLSEAIMAVGQCAAMMTSQLLWARVELEEDRVCRDVAAALTLWKPADVRIDENVSLEGRRYKHVVHFVAHKSTQNTAVDVLSSRRGRSLEKAKDYDYAWMDMERRSNEYRAWGRLAVIPSMETWSPKALGIVRDASHDTIALPTDRESELRERIPEAMSRLTSPGFSPKEKTPFSLDYTAD